MKNFKLKYNFFFKAQEILFGQYDEEKDIRNAIDNLAKNKNGIFSLEKLDSPLFIFQEGERDGFSILSNKVKNQKEKGKDKEIDKDSENLLKLYSYYCKKEKKKRKSKKFTKL